MGTTTLTDVFRKKKADLEKSIKDLELPSGYAELQKKVSSHIESLLVSDNDFRNSLNASDAEILTHALRMALSFQKMSLSESIDFKALSIQTECQEEQPKADSDDIMEDALSLLPAVICAFIKPWLAVVAGVGTVGAKKFYHKKRTRKHGIKITKKDVSRKINEDEINTILTGIESLCKEIDEIISKIQRDRNVLLGKMEHNMGECTLEKMYPQILNALQYLFMENWKNETKNPHIQNMLFSLQGYGYEVVEYSTATSGFFAKNVNPRVTEETMYLPAIVKTVNELKVVAAQGIVYIPAK